MEDETSAASFESRSPPGGALDSWGLPPSAASRRDSEEMLARVGRSESESSDAWRRIEDQLRGLGRRLDSSERSHSENNRVLSRTAQEININAREQAQAFEQLGQNVVVLNDRLERLERSAASDGLRDAVKALHQGLSRLADQITATANNSASQSVQVTANLEKLAGQLGHLREEADRADQALEQRIDVIGREFGQRMDITERAIDTRLSAVEKTVQFNTNALDHALERIETGSVQRATDLSENQRRAAQHEAQHEETQRRAAQHEAQNEENQRRAAQHQAQHEEGIHRLEDSIARLQSLLPGPELEDRLGGFERSIAGLADRLEQHDPAEKFDASIQALSLRLEQLEKNHSELVTELRAPQPQEPPPAPAPGAFEAPPFVEPPPVYEPPLAEFPSADFPSQDEARDAFASPPPSHGFTFDIPQEASVQDSHEASFTPDFADVFEETPEEEENFLARARRSARAASEKAESERHGRLSAFRWNQNAAESATDGEEKTKPRLLLPVLVALLVVAAAAAALILSQRAKMALPAPPAASALKAPTSSVPVPPKNTPFVVAPQAGSPTIVPAPMGNAQDFSSQRSEPAASEVSPSRLTAPVQPRAVSNAPVKHVPDKAAAKSATVASLDHVTQLANAGNPVALTILGLRALDGTNGAAVDLLGAVKSLTQAAEKGQAVAQYRLGTLYERGQGVPADAAKAVHWYELAANQGNRKAMHNLAVAYASGAGGKKDMAEAARWFAKAAALGLSDSQFNLAVLYERGDGVPQSLVDAFKWYSIAAAAGDTESKARISVLQTQLGDADKAAANKSAASFRAAPLNRSANVPPEPIDLGN